MTSHTTRTFWQRFHALPHGIQEQARNAYRKFQADPHHPSLKFEKLRGHPNLWSVRVTLKYRVVAAREGDTLLWFWVGTHADFDRDFA